MFFWINPIQRLNCAKIVLLLLPCLLASAVALIHFIGRAADGGDLESKIDQLVQVTEEDVGYSGAVDGSQFILLETSDEPRAVLLEGDLPERSRALVSLVKEGARAVPSLVRHLRDERKTRIPKVKGIMWTEWSDEIDRNRRLQREDPDAKERAAAKIAKEKTNGHFITVGDLCYFAIGQIVNRDYAVARYKPTGGVEMTSPSHIPMVAAAVEREWGNLTVADHRESLRRDFQEPDHARRLIGAYRRLAVYFPDEVEPLVTKQLAIPAYDGGLANTVVNPLIFEEISPEQRRQMLSQFTALHGPRYKAAVCDELFKVLQRDEYMDQKRSEAGNPRVNSRAREVLIDLFGFDQGVRSSQRPFMATWSNGERSQFLKSLSHDESRAIDVAVHRLLLEHEDDDWVAPACVPRLLAHGYLDEVEAYCKRRLAIIGPKRDSIRQTLEKIESARKPRNNL